MSKAATVCLTVGASEESPHKPRAAQSSAARVTAIAGDPLSPAPDLPSVASFDGSTDASRAQLSRLGAETRALRQARAELRAGRLSDAFATLEAARRQFPVPELYQEREALMIELLDRSGQVTTAKQRAREFLSRFPESPHAEPIRQLGTR